ncbi:hypothetical protein [Litchfieldia alkalitelluris]|uniref:hypothetical protein n=1 Tax=Litchfieldia alkalitelluris TaxID=304268 RepID=UPI000997BB26|nr:hypothetical protein [Litchfieldia alkalitelluris]
MLIIASFEKSIMVEMAISALQKHEINKEHIFAATLDQRDTPRPLFDSIHQADGFSMFDLAAILGTCFMLLGAIYGYVLTWGPIIWGIIGAVSGILLGFLIKYSLIKSRKTKSHRITSEVIIMIRTEKENKDKIENLLWEHNALGLSILKDH